MEYAEYQRFYKDFKWICDREANVKPKTERLQNAKRLKNSFIK